MVSHYACHWVSVAGQIAVAAVVIPGIHVNEAVIIDLDGVSYTIVVPLVFVYIHSVGPALNMAIGDDNVSWHECVNKESLELPRDIRVESKTVCVLNGHIPRCADRYPFTFGKDAGVGDGHRIRGIYSQCWFGRVQTFPVAGNIS